MCWRYVPRQWHTHGRSGRVSVLLGDVVWLPRASGGTTLLEQQRYSVYPNDCAYDPTCWLAKHDDVIKWKYFPRYWPFVRRIHRSPVNSPHKGQWRRGLMFSLICVWINSWVNNREAGDLRRYRAHFDVTVMIKIVLHVMLSWYRTLVSKSKSYYMW